MRKAVRRPVRISPSAPQSQALKSTFVVPLIVSPCASKMDGSTMSAA
jgi:hypothetical protein